jgi:hypothetical protein
MQHNDYFPSLFVKTHVLREERRLRVYENRVLRRILGPKRDEVTGKWRRLHNEEPYALYKILFG